MLTIGQEIEIGSLLGRGEFGDVYACISYHPGWRCRDCFHLYGDLLPQTPSNAGNPDKCEEPSDEANWFMKGFYTSFECPEDLNLSPDIRNLAPLTGDDEDSGSSAFVKADLGRKHSRSNQYVVKLVRKRSIDTCHLSRLGAILDLAREAKFLSLLNHPNIVEMHATVGDPGHPDFAIVLERLVLTLDIAIKHWKDELKHERKYALLNFAKSQQQQRAIELKQKRLLVMHDIANALHHLHGNK